MMNEKIINMYNPPIWRDMDVPLMWAPIPEYELDRYQKEIAYAELNKEIELQIIDGVVHWRRDLNEQWELGL